jgi:putative MATE family efflux protein
MQDLTTGSLTRHLLKTTSYMLVTMVFQTLYFLVDLYWVGRLGTSAVAAVAIAGNWTFIVLALTQMLGVGTTAVVSHASGRKDHAQTVLLFNQSQVLAMLTGFAFLVFGLSVRIPYAAAMSADAETVRLAGEYLLWFVPAMALQFAMVAMGSALRGVGNFKPGMIVSTGTVLLNMVLSPILIFGWGTGRAFGVAGAAMSTLVSIVVAVLWLMTYFGRKEPVLRFEVRTWRPRIDLWRRMLAIGLPAGFEFGIMAVYLVLVYSVMRPFGTAAQAAFGIGMRITQAGFMAVVALGFAVAPVAGQNFGARIAARVKATFRDAALMATGYQLAFALLCSIAAPALIGAFSDDPATVATGTTYLRIASLGFVASGLIFVASSMFQAMGNTMPALVASATRFLLFAIPLFLMAGLPGFKLTWIWTLAVVSTWLHVIISMLLLRREFSRRLDFSAPVPAVAAPEGISPEPA